MIEIKPIASGSSGNCYWISDGDTNLLIDAGISVKRINQGCGFRLPDVAAALISHEHGDHASHAQGLTRYGVEIYASPGTINALEGTRAALTGPLIHEAHPLQSFRIGSFTVLPFDVQHDAQEPLGFLIRSEKTSEKLLYFTDTYYVKYKFPGLNYIMAECNYTLEQLHQNVDAGITPAYRIQRLAKSHMSLEALEEMLQANDLSQLKQIWLIHLSNDNSNAQEMKRRIQRVTGAEVYLC